MAYGQTGTGKTYTVGRLGKDDPSERGIMVRALEDIIVNTSPASDSVEVTYLQVLKCCIKTCLRCVSVWAGFFLFKVVEGVLHLL